MFRRNHNIATEKLIHVIKDDKDDGIAAPESASFAAPVSSGNLSFAEKMTSFLKKAAVGLEIGYDRIQLVKISGGSNQKRSLVDYLSVPFDPSITQDKKRFSSFLKAHVRKISRFSRNVELWVAIPPNRLEIRYLEIPTVPKKQISNAVFWTYQKKNNFDKDKYLFDFEVLANYSRKEGQKTAVLAFTAPKIVIQEYKALFSKNNPPLAGISSAPFALQNLIKYNYLSTGGQSVCCLHIGMNRSRIDLFFPDGTLALSRKSRACMKHMIDDIQKEVSARLRENPDGSAAPTERNPTFPGYDASIEGPAQITPAEAQNVFAGLIQNSPSLSATMEQWAIELGEAEVLEMLIPSLERIVWRVERTIEHFRTEMGGAEVGKLYLSGRMSGCEKVVGFVRGRFDLPLEVSVLDPFAKRMPISQSVSLPQNPADRSSMAGAAGIAMSRNFFTPNFLFSHIQKEKYRFNERLNRFVLAGMFLLLVILAGLFMWQDRFLEQKEAEIADLRNKLDGKIVQNGLYVDQALIEQEISRVKQSRKEIKGYALRYLSLAVIKEISIAVPKEIRLLGLDAEMGSQSNKKEKERKTAAGQGKVSIEGVVLGDPLQFETILIHFISNLKNKPIFESASLEKKIRDQFEGKMVLRFILNMEIL